MKLKIALPKGRLFNESVELLYSGGVIEKRIEEGRRLKVETERFTFFLVKPFDVPIYVESGVADLGICGYDVFWERKPDVYRFLDLNIGVCRISVAGLPDREEFYRRSHSFRVATKYVRITREFFSRRGISAEIIHLSGSVEIAPLLGLSDFIVDLVQTGKTLKENGLVELEVIARSSAWIIGNRSSYRNRKESILQLLESLSEQVG